MTDGNTPPNTAPNSSYGMITKGSGFDSRWLRIRSRSASLSPLESDPLMVTSGCQSLRLPKNWATTANCSAISGASPHSTAISENGLDQKAGGEISEGGIPCVFLR